MNTLALALALVRVGLALLEHIKTQRLISEGERRAVDKLKARLDAVAEDMHTARNSVSDDPDSVSDDPYNRD